MQFIFSKHFLKQLKLYSRKFKRLEQDLVKTLKRFDKRQAVRLRGNAYKIRFRASDLPKGKSGSFRLIIYVYEKGSLLLPLTLYLKSERDNISMEEVDKHLTIVLVEVAL